jgi:hypothetical protein
VAKVFLEQKTESIAHTDAPTMTKKGLKTSTEKIAERPFVRDAV